jgi:fructose-1,6-bisphosphatase/inositol monophosphatase family enzyme
MRIDVQRVSQLMREVAAREIMPRFGKLTQDDIRTKGSPGDLVTIADEAAEQWLTAALLELLPGSVVVGEEAAHDQPELLAELQGWRPVWLIDPVDGTGNFSRGIARFAVLVALCLDGETVAGWMLDPVADVVVCGERGAGAWLDDADGLRPLRLAPGAPVPEMVGSLDYRRIRRLKAQAAENAAAGLAMPLPHFIRLGSSGREYIDLTCGRLDFAEYTRLKPWDHAAGVLLHGEAGGVSRLRDSLSAYRPQPGVVAGTLLLAPDERSWAELNALLA